MPDKNRALYKGDKTRYISGIPARNLSEDDWNALDSDQQNAVRKSELYDVRTNADMRGSSITNTPAPSAKDADSKPADTSA